MMSPSSFEVFALKFLQKSMMFRPCGPSAVPTGGAGVAFPAWICSFTIACTFFAISNLLDLQKIQFHGRRATEDRHHHFQRVLVEIHLVDHTVEARERSLVDAHVIAFFERVLRLRLLGRRLDLFENVLNFLFAQRRRLGPRADKARHLRRVLHHVPRVVGHVHLDQDVAGKKPPRALHLAAATLFDDVFGWNQNLADFVLKTVRLHTLKEGLLHLVLEARVRMNDVPVLRGDLCHAAPKVAKIQLTSALSRTSSANRYSPKNADVTMTTTVVA